MITKAELFLKDPAISQLVSSPHHPTFEAIVAVAKARGISSAYDLWEFFDLVRGLWNERKDQSEGLWAY